MKYLIHLLSISLLVVSTIEILASDTVLVDDFEGNGTISRWSGDNCLFDTAAANPFQTVENNSNQVFEYSDVGGEFANVRFETDYPFNLTGAATFTMQVYLPSAGLVGGQPNQVSLKLQNLSEDEPWTTQCEIIKPLVLDQWQTVSFDFENDNVLLAAAHLGAAVNRTDLNRVLIQFNGEGNFDPVTAYLDNFEYSGLVGVNPKFSHLVWSDEFDQNGAIDSLKWHHQTELPAGGSWFNNEIQHYTDRIENAYNANGNLNIVAKRETFTDQGETKEFTSARLNSKFAFQYGKVEVRAKLPTGVGTWPAIWLLGKNITESGAYFSNQYGDTPWPACGEIDIMEHWGWNQNYVQSATHTPSSFAATVNHGGQYISTVSDEFHTYELVWTPEKLDFSVDGVKHYIYNPAVKNADTWPFDAEQYMILNIAIEPSIEASFTEDAMEIQYVRIYQDAPLDTAVVSTANTESDLQNISVYPNPFTNQVTIELLASQDYEEILLLDSYGRVLRSFNPASDSPEFIQMSGLEDLAKGIYFLQINQAENAHTIKLIK